MFNFLQRFWTASVSSGQTPDREQLYSYRWICLLAGALVPAFGVVYRLTEPGAVDPIWQRALVALVPLGLLAGSYVSVWVRRRLGVLMRTMLYLITLWFAVLTVVNRFVPSYALGLLFVIAAVSAAFSVHLRTMRPLRYYLIFSVGVACLPAFWLPTIRTNAFVFTTCVMSLAVVSHLTTLFTVRAQRRAVRDQQRFRAAVEGSLDAFFLFRTCRDDDNHRITRFELIDANRRAEALASATRDMIGESMRALLPFYRERGVFSQLVRVAETGKSLESEFETKRSGETAWMQHQVVRAGDNLAVMLRDVTERKQAEETLRASERRYRTLMDAANDAIFVVDAETARIVESNRRAQDLVGRSADELRQMHYSKLYPSENMAAKENAFKKHVQEGAPPPSDLHFLHADGHRIPVEVSANMIEIGEQPFLLAIFRDVTKRRRYEEKLIEAREHAEEMLKLKGDILNNMSHEIRTPLTGILGFADVLAKNTEGEDQEFAEMIAQNARRLQRTLDSVLDMARLERDELVVEMKEVDVLAEVRETVSLYEHTARQQGLDLSVEGSSTRAHLDPACLHRILNNLVGNALKFTAEGRVTVRVEDTNEQVRLLVRDTGVGIDDEFLPHLFDEFRQESGGLDREHGGSGLGLAITKRLVELMNGTISVESEADAGTTFTVSFPREPERRDTERATSDGVPTASQPEQLA